jgi:hypothetical protein
MAWILRYLDLVSDDAWRAALLRRVMALFALTLCGATWPLWTRQHVFPQVPLVRAALEVPAWCQWVGAAGIVTGLTLALVAPGDGRAARGALLLFATCATSMVVLDQQRLQPWVYQFVLLALALACTEARVALGLIRLLVISFYFHSALSKFDSSFLHTLGQQFLTALCGAVGVSYQGGSGNGPLALAMVFPAGELLVAVGLCFARMRRWALCGAIVLHGLLLVILGPFGLHHKPGVLLWNGYFVVQDLLLFGVSWSTSSEVVTTPRRSPDLVVPGPMAALWGGVVLLPLLAPTSWFDMWPSWGLYASCAQRITLLVHRREAERLPAELQPFLDRVDDDEVWIPLRLDRWCLAALGAPIYPQNRTQLGVAEAVVVGCQLDHRARVVRSSLAHRWTAQRESDVLAGTTQIVGASDQYWFNSRPNQKLFRVSDAVP